MLEPVKDVSLNVYYRGKRVMRSVLELNVYDVFMLPTESRNN